MIQYPMEGYNRNDMTLRNVRFVALITFLMGLFPLILVPVVRWHGTPSGYPGFFLYLWDVIDMILLTPTLLLVGLYMFIRIVSSKDTANRSSLLVWNVPGLLVGFIAEAIHVVLANPHH